MFNRESWKHFQNKDYGTKISSSNYVNISVKINPDLILKDYSDAYASELQRRNPLRFDAAKITSEDLLKYFVGLLKMRVLYIGPSGLKDWRKAKQLWIPSYMEYIISRVGEVVDTVHGAIITPVMEDTKYNFDELLSISNKIRTFKDDGVMMFTDAMPRSREGDIQVMSCVLINDFICAPEEFQHPYGSYAAAFLGLQLMDESYASRFNVRYDDINFIRHSMLMDVDLIVGGSDSD